LKIIACVPFVNRPDLLEDCLKSITPAVDDGRIYELLVLDNSLSGFQPRGWQACHRPIVPLSFAQTQNAFQETARENDADAVLFAHSDMKCTPEALDRLISIAEDAAPGWGVIFTLYDVLCLYSRQAIDIVGPWDTQIPWYHADEDWYRRVKLAGFGIIEAGAEGVIHQNDASNTIKADWRLALATDMESHLSDFVYQQKWGGAPHQEIFSVPYDGHRLVPSVGHLVNNPLARKLAASIETDQGTLLERQTEQEISAQTRAIAWAYEQAGRPKRVVETGTCKGFFGYLLNWLAGPGTELLTYDTDPRTADICEILGEETNLRISNAIGDSREKLKSDQIAGCGLAWLDGGHEIEVCRHDIETCMKAEVPWILVDDSNLESVRNAIERLLMEGDCGSIDSPNYKEILHPWIEQDTRKIAMLVRQ
jgi:hypothetical protein